jgi:mono/diheme cytochrome c family protein
MRSWRKGLGVTVLAFGALLTAGISATIGWRPFIGPRARPLTNRHFEPTSARLERGRYLLTSGVVPCMLCHSEMKVEDGTWSVASAFSGRDWEPDGVPFLTAPNLTPDPETGTGTWPDDALARAIREGVGHDGRTLFPVMPYSKFKAMSDEDLASVIVYLRSLKPVKHQLRVSTPPFPVKYLIRSLPAPITEPVTADLSTPVKRGEYLATIGACAECHTPVDDKGNRLPGMNFAGGFKLEYTGVPTVFSRNITPSVNGIPYYTEALFIEAFRTGRVRERQLATMMPWRFYRNMRDEDLKAIFAYLQTLTPVDHFVDNSLPPTPCAKCGQVHGGGERNKLRS